MKNTFQMVSLRKQIDQMRLFHPISGAEQAAHIAGKGGRIAGHIHHARRIQRRQTLDNVFSQSAARRIDHHQIGLQLAGNIF